jgi:hypothetical protein
MLTNLYKKRLLVVIVIIVCFVSRIPQLLSPNLVLDGDECVVALMAKHIYALKGFPLYFYGQAYGFSAIECLAIVPFYFFAGFTTLAAKLAMLSLWTVGVVFLYKTFLKISDGNIALSFVLIMLLVFCPAWAEWAMKARGGYITSFTLSSIVLYLFFHTDKKYEPLRFMLTGMLSMLIYESQPLWLPGLLPFIIYGSFKSGSPDRFLNNLLAFITPAGPLLVLMSIYKFRLQQYYTPEYSFGGVQLIANLRALPSSLFASLHGHYFAMQIHKPDSWSSSFAYLFVFVISFLSLAAIYFLLMKKKGAALFNLSMLSVALSVASVLIFKEMQPRYLLPVTGYTMLALLFFIKSSQTTFNVSRFVAPVALMIGVGSLILFKDYRYTTMQKGKFGQMIRYLLARDVHHVYCADYMLTYQLLFYSNEHIIARDRPLPGRYPAYTSAIDSAFAKGQKTAFIFNELQFRNIPFAGKTKFNGYMIVFDPPKNEMEKIFQFSK